MKVEGICLEALEALEEEVEGTLDSVTIEPSGPEEVNVRVRLRGDVESRVYFFTRGEYRETLA